MKLPEVGNGFGGRGFSLHAYCCGYESEIYAEQDKKLRRAEAVVSFVWRILNSRGEVHSTIFGALTLRLPN
jgi:hypothetical protein